MKPSVIISDKEIMGGTPVFKGTRVPAEYLFGYLEDGKSIDEFVAAYPSVNIRQAKAAIRQAEKLILSSKARNENPA